MPAPSTPSHGPTTSLSFITVGAILTVLAGTSYFFFPTGAEHAILGYVRACCLILGIAMIAIGFGVGYIARQADVTPPKPASSPAAPTTVPPVAGQVNGAVGAAPVAYTTTGTTSSPRNA